MTSAKEIIKSFNAPAYALGVLQALTDGGHEAYFVGGCVRDTLLGKEPHDWDITTSATPEQAKDCLTAYRAIDTGIQHGTITAVADGFPVEVTTYRVDGDYTDHRCPDTVYFTKSIADDLRRRDFTVNAIAYNPVTGVLQDPFGGAQDLANKVIRCVDSPRDRFSEDPLRILRALRFSASLGFVIDRETAYYAHALKDSLDCVSQERITSELRKMLMGEHILPVLLEHSELFSTVITEMGDCIGFPQNNPYHKYDVWGHTARSIHYAPQDEIIRLTMLFHDIGKPFCYQDDENGRRSFKGHAHISRNMTETIMRRMRFDNKTIDAVCTLVDNHAVFFENGSRKQVRRLLAKVGEENLRRLIRIRFADVMAQGGQGYGDRLQKAETAERLIDEVLSEQLPLSAKDLAVDGHDMMGLGMQGPAIGRALQGLLRAVLDEELPNERDALLRKAEEYAREDL